MLDLKKDLAELKSGSFQHKKELDRFLDENEENLNDPYAKIMLPFLREVQSELSRLSDQVQYTERIYSDALKYFGEGPDPKRRGFPAAQLMKTEDFFGIFREFLAAYKKIKVDNVRIGEQRQIEAKRRAAAEEKEKERLEALARKEAGVDDSLVLETLLGNLRHSGGTPKQKRKARERRSAKENAGSSPAPIDGNPSDLAAAMLAKLQGAEPGSATTSPSSRPARRRERRVASGAESQSTGRESLAAVTSQAVIGETTSHSEILGSRMEEEDEGTGSEANSKESSRDASRDSAFTDNLLPSGEVDAASPPEQDTGNNSLEWFDPDRSGFSGSSIGDKTMRPSASGSDSDIFMAN